MIELASSKNQGLSHCIKCKTHGKDFLIVNPLNFKIMCKICTEISDSDNLEILETEYLNEENEDVNCDNHQNLEGIFYCDDCKIFLCGICFSKFHRFHNSNLPEDIVKNFKKILAEITSEISLIEPQIMNGIKTISDVETKITNIKESSIKRLTQIDDNIKNLCLKKSENFLKEYEKSLDNTDVDIESILNRLNVLLKKIDKNHVELKNIKDTLNQNNQNKKDCYDTCLYKKEKKNIFTEVTKIFEENQFFLNFIINETVRNAKIKIKQFKFIIDNFNKKISLYKTSVISSVLTGISSYSFKIKRFTKFSPGGIKYFRNSSLVFKTYKHISLVGFNICGLVRSNFKDSQIQIDKGNNYSNTDTQNDHSSLKIIKPKICSEFNNINRLSTAKNYLIEGFPQEKIRIQIKFIIKEVLLDDLMENEIIFEEKFYLTDSVNNIDPSITFYLKKSINLKPERLYIITVQNLDVEAYLEMWIGEVSNFFQKNMIQTIVCNTTHIKFAFYQANGVETDFNEFTSGIISDLIYSHKDDNQNDNLE